MQLTQLTEAYVINNRLEEFYGKHTVANKARFRVVWSTEQIEKRRGTFNVFHGDIFLREETGIREVEKYPFFPNCWVVERLHGNVYPDVLDGEYIYEPLFTFPEGLPLNWRAVDLVVKHALKLVTIDKDEDIPRTEKEAVHRYDKQIEKEKQNTRDMLDTTSLETALNDGNAISFSNTEGKDYRPSKLIEKIGEN